MENNSQRKRIVLGVMLIAVVVITIAGTFAYFVSNTQSTEEKLTVTTGTLALTFSDNTSVVALNNLQFGQSTSKRFTIENTGTLDVTTNMLWNNLINTYTEGSLTYTFEYSTNETGPWTAVPNASGNIPQNESASDRNLATEITIPAHTTYYYQLTITLNHLADVDQTADKTAILNSNFKLGNKIDPTIETLAALNVTPKPGNPDFATPATTDEGVYSMADDYGTSYYYRGAVENNYVKFGKWAEGTTLADGTNASGKDMWWRIIRVNGDGSIRMIYDGTTPHKNANGTTTFTATSINGSKNSEDRFTHTSRAFNRNGTHNAYVGWMYGTVSGTKEQAQTNTNNSPIKDLVNSWYDANLIGYDQYIADAVYCADRTIPGKSVTGTSWDTGLGTGQNATVYGAYHRFFSANKTNQPRFTCPQKNDAFTVSDGVHGNAIGTTKSRKIGLITADEIVAAGGTTSTNYYYYLYRASDYWYWTLSPSNMYTSGSAYVFIVYNSISLNDYIVNMTYGAVAPVISIKAEYARTMTGEGTASSPFQIAGVA